MSDLSAADYESIDRASRKRHELGWCKAFNLDEMLGAWESLVAEVEAGYGLMVDEYTNDLACRDWLAVVWPMVTERVRDAWSPELAALDARFKEASEDDGGQAIGRFYRVQGKDGWWWRRRPKNGRGEFAADLASE
ncbi:hypothetical protein [Cellulomonas sp.]|uniref:hypothetical protein n=1 Tax=Cellulomonas sp. TaxID=40001 RepID=UPI00258E8AE3|nr:hypothetical protein [Cellulomonas sp.]MCR6689856.1 hypothetical protein [Cellulomonas sp.]